MVVYISHGTPYHAALTHTYSSIRPTYEGIYFAARILNFVTQSDKSFGCYFNANLNDFNEFICIFVCYLFGAFYLSQFHAEDETLIMIQSKHFHWSFGVFAVILPFFFSFCVYFFACSFASCAFFSFLFLINIWVFVASDQLIELDDSLWIFIEPDLVSNFFFPFTQIESDLYMVNEHYLQLFLLFSLFRFGFSVFDLLQSVKSMDINHSDYSINNEWYKRKRMRSEGQGQGEKRPMETISIATYFCSLYF